MFLRLPAPPVKYDISDQAQMRRAVEDLALRIPEPVAAVAAGTTLEDPPFITADQTVAGGGATNFTVVSEIGTFAVLANEKWLLEWDLIFNPAGATGGMLVRVQGPAGVNGLVWIHGNTNSVTTWVINIVAIGTAGGSQYGNGTTGNLRCIVRAMIEVGATPGNVTLEFDPIGAVNTSIKKYSVRSVARKLLGSA